MARTSKGSGRTKGAFSFALVSIAELKSKIADENMKLPVSRKFLESLGFTDLVAKRADKLNDTIEGTTPTTKVDMTLKELD